MATENENTMSLDGFREIIGTQPNPALVIWNMVAAYIEKTEDRIIDAEFAKTEAENALKPFAIKFGASSLSKALGHVTREDLERAAKIVNG